MILQAFVHSIQSFLVFISLLRCSELRDIIAVLAVASSVPTSSAEAPSRHAHGALVYLVHLHLILILIHSILWSLVEIV